MKILNDLVGINSVSGNENQILEYIQNHLSSIGFKPILLDGGVVLHIKGIQKNKALMFNSHVDTVSPGVLNSWKYKPFEALRIGEKVYGLGASDEKAAVATLLLLADKYKNKMPPLDLWLMFVKKEEVDGSGTKFCLNWILKNYKYKKIAGILGEPTNLEKIEIAHKGNLFVKIAVKGDSGHASNPVLVKEKSIVKAIKVVQRLKIVAKNWELQYKDNTLGRPTLSVTSINSNETSPNKFPEFCEIVLDIRTTPILHKKVMTLLKEELKKFKVSVETLYEPAPFGYTSKNSEIVKITKKITNAKVTVSSSSNDLCFFTVKGIPAIVFGPGNPGVIHKSDEWCEIGKIVKCIHDYQQIIYTYSIFDLTTKISGGRFIP